MIEALVAVIILVIGLMAVTQFFPFSLKVTGDSQSITTASVIALEKIEEIAALNYDDVAVGIIEAKHQVSSDPNDYLYHYQRQAVVQTVDSDFSDSPTDVGLKKITVTVFWQSPVRSTEQSIQFNTLISKY